MKKKYGAVRITSVEVSKNHGKSERKYPEIHVEKGEKIYPRDKKKA